MNKMLAGANEYDLRLQIVLEWNYGMQCHYEMRGEGPKVEHAIFIKGAKFIWFRTGEVEDDTST